MPDGLLSTTTYPRVACPRALFLCLVAWLSTLATCLGWAQRPGAESSSGIDSSLKRFLQDYVGRPSLATTKACLRLVDLNNDRQDEAIAYLTGNGWCGSGGCTMLILARHGDHWRVITKATLSRPPIRVLNTSSKGWRSIAVWVQGGGIQPGFEAELRFDGNRYPTNPSVPPALPTVQNMPGEVLVRASDQGTPLFP